MISDYGAVNFLNEVIIPWLYLEMFETLSSLVEIFMKMKVNFTYPLGIQYWLFKWVIQEKKKEKNQIHHVNLGSDSDPQIKEILFFGK